jgi:hypothetical protein
MSQGRCDYWSLSPSQRHGERLCSSWKRCHQPVHTSWRYGVNRHWPRTGTARRKIPHGHTCSRGSRPSCLLHTFTASSPGLSLGAPRSSVASGAGLEPGVPRGALAQDLRNGRLVPFPFSDLSQAKLRPAIVLADAGRRVKKHRVREPPSAGGSQGRRGGRRARSRRAPLTDRSARRRPNCRPDAPGTSPTGGL